MSNSRNELKGDDVPTVKEETKEKKRKKHEKSSEDNGLEDILGAIRAAPKDDKPHHKKRVS